MLALHYRSVKGFVNIGVWAEFQTSSSIRFPGQHSTGRHWGIDLELIAQGATSNLTVDSGLTGLKKR